MTVVESPRTDAKAGYCSNCRSGSCSLCMSSSCSCPDGRKHRNRPDYAKVPDNQRRPAPRGAVGGPPRSLTRVPKPAAKPEVIFELVEADPPVPPPKLRKLTNAERARPLLEQLMAEGNRKWHRICIHHSPHAAGRLAVVFRKAFPKSEWEFRAVTIPEVGQGAVYARWLGEKGAQL